MAKDISYTQGQERFRYRAAALIIEEEALCVISSPSEDYFYSVGGAVRFGETPKKLSSEKFSKRQDKSMRLKSWLLFMKIYFQTQPASSRD